MSKKDVLNFYPEAHANTPFDDTWFVYVGDKKPPKRGQVARVTPIGTGETEEAAWVDAWTRILEAENRVWHELKTDPLPFDKVWTGSKNFEIRKNDRNYQLGDGLQLRETQFSGEEMADGSPLVYTGRQITCLVSYILHGPVYGLEEGWCIMSISNVRPETVES